MSHFTPVWQTVLAFPLANTVPLPRNSGHFIAVHTGKKTQLDRGPFWSLKIDIGRLLKVAETIRAY